MLKESNIQEAIIGLVMTIIITYIKNSYLNKESKMQVLIVSGLGWAAHYLARKYLLNNIKSKELKNN